MLPNLHFLLWIYSSLPRKLETLVPAAGTPESRRRKKLKAVSGIMLMLLLASMLTLAFSVQPTKSRLSTGAVNGGGPADLYTIQEAVNVASPGENIYDCNGAFVIVESNSTISNFETFPEDKKISFVVDGATGTPGFCNVTIPFKLLGGPYLVWFDGEIMWLNKQETTNDTHVFIYFTYTHSTHTVEITGTTWGSPTISPVADFFPSNTTPSVSEKVIFDASASYDPDGTIESWNWNLGDGTTKTGEIVDHTYTTAGTFTVTLTVIDDEGLIATAKTDIIVLAAVRDVAITSVTVSPTKARVGEPVSISVVVTNQGDSSETFEVTVYCDNTEIKTETIANLAPSNSRTLGITWETADIDPGTYTIEVVAGTVPDETETHDNYAGNTVTITEKDGPPIPLHYVIVALAITVILIVASIAYFMKVRKAS